MDQPAFTPVRIGRASDELVAQIRAAILSGRYCPGDRLPTERELAQQFGVSRVTVRDALRSLEAGGLIEVRVGGLGGPYVAQPSIAQVSESLGTHLQRCGTTFAELAEARLALETTAARLAAERATPDDLEAMQAAIQRPARPASVSASETAVASLDFHTALVRAAHNGALLVMFTATRTLIQGAFDHLHAVQPDMADVARKVHGELFAAVAEHDAEAAARIMREHMYDFARRAERTQAAAGSASTAAGSRGAASRG